MIKIRELSERELRLIIHGLELFHGSDYVESEVKYQLLKELREKIFDLDLENERKFQDNSMDSIEERE